MSEARFCPKCGTRLEPSERFCSECGLDINALSDEPQDIQETKKSQNFQPQVNAQKSSSKKAVVIVAVVLVLLFLIGGGLYRWFSDGRGGNIISNNNSTNTGQTEQTTEEFQTEETVDLTRAATYLQAANTKCTVNVNYQDGFVGTLERISGKVVSQYEVIVSDVEIVDNGNESYGYGTHYVERTDGTYIIYDSSIYELSPLLKNNLTIAKTWTFETEYGNIDWKVMDMGITLDLGFAKIPNCLVIEENNQVVGLRTIQYYAPGFGKVFEKSADGGLELYKVTSYSQISEDEAQNAIKTWATNYAEIKDGSDSSNSSTGSDFDNSNEYILPESNSKYLTDNDIVFFSKEQLALARNEIFARYGYVFQNKTYLDYFTSKSWYKPNTSYKGDVNTLNAYEKYNLNLIQKYENK